MAKRKRTSDAVEILRRRYYEGRNERLNELDQARADDAIARQIRDLREKEGLTQKALADLVGTTPSAICRLEDADYRGHSLTMLKKIAAVLNRKIVVRFVSAAAKSRAA
jgi:DNA-binding XRE family transcriptional regulator